MAEIVIRLGATQTYNTFTQIVTYINTLGNLNGDSLTVLCDAGVYSVTKNTIITLLGGTLETHLTFKSTPEDRHLGENGAGVVFGLDTGTLWNYSLTIRSLFVHFEDIEFNYSGIIDGYSNGPFYCEGSSANKFVFNRCIFSVDVYNSLHNYSSWIYNNTTTEIWLLACKLWNPLGNRVPITYGHINSRLVMVNCSGYITSFTNIASSTNSIIVNNIIAGQLLLSDVRDLQEFRNNLGNQSAQYTPFLYTPYDPSNLIAGSISSIGYLDGVNGDLRINRGCLGFDTGADMSEYLTHDITYTPITTWSMGCYHLLEIPNSSLPQPTDCSKISPFYRNAESIILADPNNGQGMTTVPSDKLDFIGGNGLSYEPSMYGTICKVENANFGIGKQYFSITNKLNGLSKCTLSVLYKHTYIYGGWQVILSDYAGFFSLIIYTNIQTARITFSNINWPLDPNPRADADYSSFINVSKWCNYFVVYNGNGVSNSDKLKLYITSFGMLNEIPLTFTGTIPSVLSTTSYQGFGGGGGEWGNIVIYNKDLSKDDISELLTDPYKMYRDPTLMEDVIQYGWLKYIKNATSDQMPLQMVGQQSLNRYQ